MTEPVTGGKVRGKVLLLALSDDYWTPFVADLGRLLAEHGIESVVAVDSRAGEYQCFGGRAGARMGRVYYFADFLRDQTDKPRPALEEPVAPHTMFSDYFRLRFIGALRQIETVNWRHLAQSMAEFFRWIIEKEHIAVIVSDQVSTSFGYACYEVAKAKGVSYLGLLGACTPERYEARETIHDDHKVVDRIYQEILNGITPLTDEEKKWARAYFDDFDDQEPSYMRGKENILNDAKWHRYINWPKLRSFLRKCWYEVRERREVAYSSFREPPVIASLRSLYINMLRLYRKRRFRAFAKPVDETWMNEHRFVIYPLHVQPEASTSVGSPHFVNQFEVIKNTAFSLPPDAWLVVKEHRSAIGFNPASFYRDIAALPGVRLVGPDTNIKRLLRKSEGVVALTSTAAFEGLLLGKPAWLLGSTPFQGHPLCKKIASFEELAEALRQRDVSHVPVDHHAFLVAYRRYTRPGSLRYSEPCWGIGDDLVLRIKEQLNGRLRAPDWSRTT